jgi:GGDEF domain-containing protein
MMVSEQAIPLAVESGGWYDAETGLLGPRTWSAILGVESARCVRYRRCGTIVIVDVAGLADRALLGGPSAEPRDIALIGSVLRADTRSSDYVARLERSRFGILLPETDEIAAVNFVERVRESSTSAARRGGHEVRCVFGWADATSDRSLSTAAEIAVARLASDRGPG